MEVHRSLKYKTRTNIGITDVVFIHNLLLTVSGEIPVSVVVFGSSSSWRSSFGDKIGL